MSTTTNIKEEEDDETMKKSLNPYDFFNDLDKDIIAELVDRFYTEEEELIEGNLVQQVKALSDDAMATSIEHLLKKCTKPILLKFDKEFAENNYTKPVMVAKLADVLFEKGIVPFFEDFDVSDILEVASKFFEVETKNKDEILEKLEEETYLQGLTKFFEHFSMSDLKSWCKRRKIKVASTSKKRFARAIIFGHDQGQTNSRTTKTNENKPEIDKSISKADLKQHYTVALLKKFCKSNGIKKTGTKDVLVDRIITFLNGGEVEMENSETKSKKKEQDLRNLLKMKVMKKEVKNKQRKEN